MENEWGDRPPRTRIVAISADRELDGENLRETFGRCVAATGQVAPNCAIETRGQRDRMEMAEHSAPRGGLTPIILWVLGLAYLALVVSGCATPVGMQSVDIHTAYRIHADQLSNDGFRSLVNGVMVDVAALYPPYELRVFPRR